MNQREITAHHEAGHAVVGHTVGLDVDRADVIEVDVRGGMVHFTLPAWTAVERNPQAPRVLAWVRGRAVATWAGPLAEERFAGVDEITSLPICVDWLKRLDARGDELGRLLVYAEPSAVDPLRDFDEQRVEFAECTRAEALAELERNWSAVELVAAALLESTVLTGPAVRGLISWNKSREVQPNGCTI